MDFRRKAAGAPTCLAVLAGAFDPPTRAHLALAWTALQSGAADEVLFVVPRKFPHKQYGAVGLEARLKLLEAAVGDAPRFSIAVSEGGLFLEIARECRAAYGQDVRLRFLCGSDAAERITGWDYSGAGQPPIEEQLGEYELLVARRHGTFQPPPHLSPAVAALELPEEFEEVSSTAVRERIARGESGWRDLVPEAIRSCVAKLYVRSR